MLRLLLALLLLSSCSSKKNASSEEYLRLNSLHKQKHRQCIQQRDLVLKKAVTELEDAVHGDENYLFVRDEKKALSFIEKFDVSLFTQKENLQEYQAMINGCVARPDPKHVTCNSLMEAYGFFRGLIYGMNQYQWSRGTVEKAKQLTLNYLQYVAESEFSLMDIMLANDLFQRLANKGYIDRTFSPKAQQLRLKAESHFQELKKRYRKISKKKITCEDTADFYRRERLKVSDLSQEFKQMLNSFSFLVQ